MARRTAPDPPRSRAEVVVGVGASAGGLEAMLLLFAGVKPNGRVAYVVAQHMAHGAHTDLVARVIQRETVLPVSLAVQNQRLEADRIYVIPADHDGVLRNGALHLLTPSPQQVSTPSVDTLLESIASQAGPRGWAVVLSGAGWDGAQGSRAVQRAGGVVVVQDPAEAGFPSMPEAAAGAGEATRTMLASQIGPWIDRQIQLAESGLSNGPLTGDPGEEAVFASPPAARLQGDLPPEDLSAVIARVREVTRIDFGEYRPETLRRRLDSRRRQVELDPRRYEALLMRDLGEAELLQRLFLVSLSAFWRDRECFESLADLLAPRLLAKPEAEAVRVWVPGCASGEEAFTLAALLSDTVSRLGLRLQIEVVGTDLNTQALEQARAGRYPTKAFREAPAGWPERWFTREDDGFTARPELARQVRFERADVEDGVPASLQGGLVDLVSCRNLMIYFLPSKQERLLARFRDALRPDGLLFIGPSERLGPAAQAAFRALNAERRVYARRS